ncbi:MAG: MlaE family ABC transporter permease [Polyangiales bacterium]
MSPAPVSPKPPRTVRRHTWTSATLVDPTVRSVQSMATRIAILIQHIGQVSLLTRDTLVALTTTRFEWRAWVRQIELVGVRSFGIAAATSIFVGVVMAIQFAFALEKFGAKDTIGRIVAMSEARELAPSLTALVVGSRVGAGMAAELGSMQVTEQIDAIRALGADPVRKLVLPRVLAAIVIMPMLGSFALMLGVLSAMLVSWASFGIPMPFFLSTAIDSIGLKDVFTGLAKTPFFGYLIAIVGCHFGMQTRGGTEGVGRATTSAVVVVSITVLIADAVLSQVFLSM